MKKLREPIKAFIGPMYAQKTAQMLHEVRAAEAVGYQGYVFKPEADDRYGPDEVRSRGGAQHFAHTIPNDHPEQVLNIIDQYRDTTKERAIVGFDEVQFNQPLIAEVIKEITEAHGMEVVVCGLNRDYRGNSFETMEKVLPLATQIQVLEARCMFKTNGDDIHLCGADAQMTQRLVNNEPDSYNSPTVIIQKEGTSITYEARCLNHWQVADMPQKRIK